MKALVVRLTAVLALFVAELLTDKKQMKQYKITDNGLLFIYIDGLKHATYFYHSGSEKIWEEAGYERI